MTANLFPSDFHLLPILLSLLLAPHPSLPHLFFLRIKHFRKETIKFSVWCGLSALCVRFARVACGALCGFGRDVFVSCVSCVCRRPVVMRKPVPVFTLREHDE